MGLDQYLYNKRDTDAVFEEDDETKYLYFRKNFELDRVVLVFGKRIDDSKVSLTKKAAINMLNDIVDRASEDIVKPAIKLNDAWVDMNKTETVTSDLMQLESYRLIRNFNESFDADLFEFDFELVKGLFNLILAMNDDDELIYYRSY